MLRQLVHTKHNKTTVSTASGFLHVTKSRMIKRHWKLRVCPSIYRKFMPTLHYIVGGLVGGRRQGTAGASPDSSTLSLSRSRHYPMVGRISSFRNGKVSRTASRFAPYVPLIHVHTALEVLMLINTWPLGSRSSCALLRLLSSEDVR
jgi:hypothetical protein